MKTNEGLCDASDEYRESRKVRKRAENLIVAFHFKPILFPFLFVSSSLHLIS